VNRVITVNAYKKAYEEIVVQEEKKGFRIHSIVYMCVNVLLIVINLIFVREFIWFIFPLVGWGIGLAMHYLFGIRKLNERLKEKEAEAEAKAIENLER
jgi:hypothetical protein